jgi:predicted TIM-barrel fold metal-dependent hydrolase
MSRIHLSFLVCAVIGLALPRFFGQEPEAPKTPTEGMPFYLLIGGANMGGRAEIPADAGELGYGIQLLNDKNEWEPARSPLNLYSTIAGGEDLRGFGPGEGFVRGMRGDEGEASVGLVLNAAAGTKIEDWLGKSKIYWGARGRTKAAMRKGSLKGVIWMHGEGGTENPEAYAKSLRTLISNLRNDFGDINLPVVIGPAPGDADLNAALLKLKEDIPFTDMVGSEGLTTPDGVHFDTASQLALGKRFAERMVALRTEAADHKPMPPSDIRFIDPHVHAMSVTPLGLRAVAKWMDERNVERCIVSPLSHKGSRPQTEEEREVMLANFSKYKGRIDRMALIEPGEVATVDEAVAILKREKADGAIAFGEHYGKGLMFDDPKNLLLYEACEKTGLPVMFHIDQNKNMVEPGMARVDRVLKKFPDCKIVAHAYWWRQLSNGTCDRQLQEHPNLYADMSGHVVVQLLSRDRKYAREFLIRNQDKILWATDEGWWSFGDQKKQMNLHYTFFEELDLPEEVRRKIYRGNAEKVYGLR